MGDIPPPSRNHRLPTACDTPAAAAASSLEHPPAISRQNRCRSSRRATDGRPGDHICPRTARIACCRLPTPIAHHLHHKVLRRPVESAQYTSIDYRQTLDDHGVLASVGSVGDAYDNALAESVVDSFKTELIADRI